MMNMIMYCVFYSVVSLGSPENKRYVELPLERDQENQI